MTTETLDKRARCEAIIQSCGRVLVAYSGGIDSTLVAKIAYDVLGDDAQAATAVSPSLAKADLEDSIEVSRAIGIRHHLINSDETDDPTYQANSPQRCYVCKSTAYELFTDFARRENFAYVLDGTNLDDVGDHRPGRRAAKENNVRSPLQEAGLNKEEVRAWAKDLGLSNWDKPANACLSSRVPFGMEVTPAKLAQIESAEGVMRSLGFRQCRVRHHGQIARVEVEAGELAKALELRGSISSALKEKGFLYVTLDLDGFRSGSMNEALNLHTKA